MPRRPRPARREAPKTKVNAEKINARTAETRDVDSDDESQEELEEIEGEELLSGHGGGDFEEESEYEDADAPRVVQWVGALIWKRMRRTNHLKHIQSDLSGLPLGALRRAQNVLRQTEDSSSSEDEAESGSDDGTDDETASKDDQEEDKKPEWSLKPRTDISKRKNKHAPTEVTSKRPVTRRRTVVEMKKVEARDPRFLPTAGEYSAAKFQQNYGFLADSHKTELAHYVKP
ncbi:hypothetical protein BDQ17DRAFT_18856 [Cyathus striatus]|nr:hypothetical protein BDQ17DRAFT_18856 [Cyathus striatus]